MTAEYMQPLNDWQVSLVRGYAVCVSLLSPSPVVSMPLSLSNVLFTHSMIQAMTGMQFDGNVTHPFGLQTEADGAKFMREQFSKLRASVLGRK